MNMRTTSLQTFISSAEDEASQNVRKWDDTFNVAVTVNHHRPIQLQQQSVNMPLSSQSSSKHHLTNTLF